MRFQTRKVATTVVLSISLLGLALGCGKDGDGNPTGPITDTVVPAAWAGIWEVTNTTTPCAGGTPEMDVSVDTLCAGQSLSEILGDEGFEIDCTGSMTDTAINVTCTSSFDFGVCSGTITITMNATRSGDTISGTQQFEVEYAPACETPNTCETITLSGSRTGTGGCP